MKDILMKIFLHLVSIWWLVMSGLCFWQGSYIVATLFLLIGIGMFIYFIYDYLHDYLKYKKQS